MVKHLTIIYNPGTGPPMQLYDGPVEELVLTDGANSIKVEGRLKKAAGGQGGTIFDLIGKASKANTQKMIDDKRESASD